MGSVFTELFSTDAMGVGLCKSGRLYSSAFISSSRFNSLLIKRRPSFFNGLEAAPEGSASTLFNGVFPLGVKLLNTVFIESNKEGSSFFFWVCRLAPFFSNCRCRYSSSDIHSLLYTGEDLKPYTAGVLCFKSLPVPLPWGFKTSRFKSPRV